jgi:hypothetical protein
VFRVQDLSDRRREVKFVDSDSCTFRLFPIYQCSVEFVIVVFRHFSQMHIIEDLQGRCESLCDVGFSVGVVGRRGRK